MAFPYVFTFYSYKGGVGRSLALLNVAYALVNRGRHVLIVDMDLEAPGVSGFLNRADELGEPGSLDILEFLDQAIDALPEGESRNDPDALRAAARGLQPVTAFIQSVREDKLASLQPKLGKVGRLDVLGADLNRDYFDRLAGMRLKMLDPGGLVGLSNLLRIYCKAQTFPLRPLWLEEFEEPIDTHYDYVLVDSRTGITEIGGLCVGPFAERLVVITGLNDQNVEGTRSFLHEVGIRRRGGEDEPWDEADKARPSSEEGAGLGPKPTILVASPVPAGEIDFKRKRLAALTEALGIRPMMLSYHPRVALMEAVFVRDFREEYLSEEYVTLTERLMSQVNDDPSSLFAKVNDLLRSPDRKLETLLTTGLRLALHGPSWVFVLQIIVNDLGTSHKSQLRPVYAWQAQIPVMRVESLQNWGTSLSEQAKLDSGDEADRLFAAAYRKFEEAARLDVYDAQTFVRWGAALLKQAKMKAAGEANRLFLQACVRCADAVRLSPRSAAAFSNWGGALVELAVRSDGSERLAFIEDARQNLQRAEKLKPGSALYNLACLAAFEGQVGKALELLRAAFKKELVSSVHLQTDLTLASLRDQPEFQELLAEIKAREAASK